MPYLLAPHDMLSVPSKGLPIPPFKVPFQPSLSTHDVRPWMSCTETYVLLPVKKCS